MNIPILDAASKAMQEDCLIANIIVPDTKEKKLPVVVYVHGGAFFMGYGNWMSLNKLVSSSKKIIAITFNYRLGAHGFLCLGTEDAPGNAGIKDQVALLRWVKRNIAKFGGNPDDVTIAGGSAGSTSVGLLMLSKMAKGLFTKVIPESGSNISPFSTQIDPLHNAKEYAKLLQFDDVENFDKLHDFYKTASLEKLQSANVIYRTHSEFLMQPCVERDVGQEMFLEEDPVSILKKGDFQKLPTLYGFANMEGLLRIDIFDTWKGEMNRNFADFLPPDLKFHSEGEKVEIADKVKKFYFGDKGVGDDTVLGYVDYFSDVMFACPTLRSVNYQLRVGNDQIYLYEYSYVDDSTPTVPYTDVRGANHCAQTLALFDGVNMTTIDETVMLDDLRTMKRILRELWSNFIITGKPQSSSVPPWPPVGSSWSPHMALKKNPELRGSLLKERCTFWEEIFDQYYNAPIPSSPPSITHSEL